MKLIVTEVSDDAIILQDVEGKKDKWGKYPIVDYYVPNAHDFKVDDEVEIAVRLKHRPEPAVEA